MQVIEEASDKPVSEISTLAEQLLAVISFKANIDDYFSDDQAAALLAMLRKNLSVVRTFLKDIEGFYDTHTDFLGGYDDQNN